MVSESKSVDFSQYLHGRTKTERLSALADMARAGTYMPISLAEDLLTLEIGQDEKLAILARTNSRDNLALEHFLTTQIAGDSQELAATALRLWSHNTDNLLWFRMLQVVQSPIVAQRVFYTVIDLAFRTGGAALLKAALTADGIEEMSTAMHGLILHRACQWQLEDPRLTALAHACVESLNTNMHPDNKSMPSALAYLRCFHPEAIEALLASSDLSEPWRDYIRAMVSAAENQDKQNTRISKLLHKAGEINFKQVEHLWPPVWDRSSLSAEIVGLALSRSLASQAVRAPMEASGVYPWELFAGIKTGVLEEGLAEIKDDSVLAAALSRLGGLLASPASAQLLEIVRGRLTATSDPAKLLAELPLRLRLELTDESGSRKINTPFAALKKEQAAVLSGDKSPPVAIFHDYPKDGDAAPQRGPNVATEDPGEMANRKRFFALAYHEQKVPAARGDGFFHRLTDAWQQPSEAKLASLAEVSRQVDGVLRLCYINTLGRFKGHDQAVLKLMDFVRASERDILRAVLQALGGIGTPRAAQELVASLTRPNITPALQLEACAALQNFDLANLQKELHSAVNDLGVETDRESIRWEVRETVVGLLHSSALLQPIKPAPEAPVSLDVSDARLDQDLGAKIPNYRELSSEVKRALRTSQFFHMQTTANSAPSSIDLSPVIDMQYKSLELLFREVYEEACSRLIHRGVLQRRLDVIGYARPIPRAMDEFEHFIATLPVVREIPFFSNFKLRKMLRAICQFRPGRRFTLDGLKAFALFFLCFSRSECNYGLAGLFPLGFRSDAELFQYCRSLHVLQDFRNRAAHEGFHPDASNDIDGIWRSTAEIVQTVFFTKKALDEAMRADYTPRNRSNPIIEKKVS